MDITELTEVPGWGYASVTDLTEVPGTVAREFRAGIKMLYPYPEYLWHGRTGLTDVPGTGMNVVHILQKFRVRV